MAKALSGIGKVAGIVSQVAMLIPGGQVVAAIAAAVAVTASIGAAIIGPGYTGQGAPTDINIGANMPSPYAIGDFYSGGSRVAQVAYGSENGVPNSYLFVVDVDSVAGPIAGYTAFLADFTALSFSGTAETDYYSNNTLYRDYQLGATNESDALAPHWGGVPDWGGGYKISGKAAVAYNARYPKDQKRYGAGFPQMGRRGQGVLSYDPREDSTYPGGSGAHRWASPTDTTDFAAAKATWTYSGGNPGIEALKLALGSWERDEDDGDAIYRKIFGIGGAIEQIVVADFVELANVCDANGWSCNGVIFEGLGISKWDNLKRILAAGGARPCFKGGRLGLKISAPRVPIATITMRDIGPGGGFFPGTIARETRKNTLNPYYVSANHKWAQVPSSPVQISDYVTEDGGERAEDFRLDLVTNANQANQLAGYALTELREQPFRLTLFPRYPAGSLLAFDDEVRAYFGIRRAEAVLDRRGINLGQMIWAGEFLTETSTKHDLVLALTGTSPPIPTIPTPEERDGIVSGDPVLISTSIRGAYIRISGPLLSSSESAGSATITIADHVWDYPDQDADVERSGGTITGLALDTEYHVYFDDASQEDETPTYHATLVQSQALNSNVNPFRHYVGAVTTPLSGGGPIDGGGGGGGYCVTPDMRVLMANQTTKPAGTVLAGEWVWAWHEGRSTWGSFPVTAVKHMPADQIFEAEISGKTIRGSADHPVMIDGEWQLLGDIGLAQGPGRVVMLTVADAHTYVANGVLSHNKEVEP